MFDIGFSELLVIAVVALIVLGPERLPKAARFAGLWVRRARAQWYSVKSELERELAAEELKNSLEAAKGAVHDARQAAEDAGRQLESEMRAAKAQTERGIEDLRRQAVDGPESAAPAPALAPPETERSAPPDAVAVDAASGEGTTGDAVEIDRERDAHGR